MRIQWLDNNCQEIYMYTTRIQCRSAISYTPSNIQTIVAWILSPDINIPFNNYFNSAPVEVFMIDNVGPICSLTCIKKKIKKSQYTCFGMEISFSNPFLPDYSPYVIKP